MVVLIHLQGYNLKESTDFQTIILDGEPKMIICIIECLKYLKK
jgi:hypothetical protein